MELVPIRCLIPDRLKQLGKNQAWLSDKTGIPKQRISDYIHLRVTMSFATAMMIAPVLGIKVEHIYVWERRGE